jgi:hypothetical protein
MPDCGVLPIRRSEASPTITLVIAAIFNLNHHASYAHWHFIDVSVSNILVVVAMLVVFAIAIWVRLPSHDRESGSA